MLTAIRLHARRASEAATNAPPPPATISWTEHHAAIQILTNEYELKLNAFRDGTEGAAGEGLPTLEEAQAAIARIAELEALVSTGNGLADKFTDEQAKSESLAKQLEALTADFNALGERLEAEEKKASDLAKELAAALARCSDLEALFDEATKATPTAVVAPAESSPAPSSTPAGDTADEPPPTKPDAAPEKSEAAESKASGKSKR